MSNMTKNKVPGKGTFVSEDTDNNNNNSDIVSLDKFLDCKLTEISNGREGSTFKLNDLLSNNNSSNGSIILAVRRPGWPLCRKEALDIANVVRPLSSKPQLIAIVHENIGNELPEFQQYWPGGNIYLNNDKSIYYAFGNGSLRTISFKRLFSIQAIKDIGSKVIKPFCSGSLKGNIKGRGDILGGVIVVDKNKQMIYQCM